MDYNTESRPGEGPIQSRGFFTSLFDFSFRSFVTSRVIGILYVISIIVLVLDSIFWIALAFRLNTALGVLTLLIIAPLIFFLMLISVRVLLEIVVILFRIAENTSEMVRQGRR